MSGILRVVLLLASIFTARIIIVKIQKAKLKMGDAIFWVVFGVTLLVLAIFPGISYFIADVLGIISPVNFVFLLIITLLCEKLLTVTIKLSLLEEKLEIMAAEIAIRTHSKEQSECNTENEERNDKEKDSFYSSRDIQRGGGEESLFSD